MNNILDKWDTLISVTLVPQTNCDYTGALLSDIKSNIVTERNVIRKYLINESFELRDDKQTEILIQRTQNFLIVSLDRLHQYMHTASVDSNLHDIYKTVAEELQFLLNSIETDFRKYFNVDEKVPDSYLAISKTELLQQYTPVKEILAARAELDKEFVNTLHKTMAQFCSNENEECTYRDLIYHKELIKELLKLGKLTKADCMYSKLKELLIYIDFNSPYFINYFFSQFKSLKTTEELAHHQKEISLMHTKPGFRLYPNRPSVKQSLVDALQKEIDFLHTRHQHQMLNSIENSNIDGLVTLSLTGVELYLAVKALVDVHAVVSETYKTMICRIAPHISNKYKKAFSAESLLKNSDKVTPEDRENVKKLLQRMIRALE